MNKIAFHTNLPTFPATSATGSLDVLLYGPRPPRYGSGCIGNPLPLSVARLGVPVDQRAYDFLTVALAVIAADTFVDRARWSADGWSRSLELEIPLGDPKIWEAVTAKLEQALHFLSGDQWKISFSAGGAKPPSADAIRRRHRSHIGIGPADCVSLFSGGLDSFLGVSKLVRDGRMPVLVSHAYRGDQSYQRNLAPLLGRKLPRFAANANPVKSGLGHNDTSMRTRSFGFLAYGVVVASAVLAKSGGQQAPLDLFVPENGFIALNAPLTRRRVGSHSTRTTHPHFLDMIQQILDAVGLNVKLTNEFRHMTKGEMLVAALQAGQSAADFSSTMSCGKWKRNHEQCGHCVPCMIRRAAFARAGIGDNTPYRYLPADAWKNVVINDDIMAMVLATQEQKVRLRSRAIASGPLPLDQTERDGWFGVYERGLSELKSYLLQLGICH